MCFGYQSSPKKLITNAKISCPAFDIHISKFAIIEWHSTKIGKTYNRLIFFINLDSNSLRICFLERKTVLGHKYILNFLTNYFYKL